MSQQHEIVLTVRAKQTYESGKGGTVRVRFADNVGRIMDGEKCVGEVSSLIGGSIEIERDGRRYTVGALDIWQAFVVAAEASAVSPEGAQDFNLRAHLQRQRAFSERTFGPGARTAGVVDHIRKELREIEAEPGDLREWIDVAILALDGAWRAGFNPDEIIDALVTKQARNEARQWPDWCTAPPDKAIEHVKAASLSPSPTTSESTPDVVCEHGTALDVHCCGDGGLLYPGCHSGFVFNVKDCRCHLATSAPSKTHEWAAENCHMLARREIRRLNSWRKEGGETTPIGMAVTAWEHIIRICEKAGIRSGGVLRAPTTSEPTTTTD